MTGILRNFIPKPPQEHICHDPRGRLATNDTELLIRAGMHLRNACIAALRVILSYDGLRAPFPQITFYTNHTKLPRAPGITF